MSIFTDIELTLYKRKVVKNSKYKKGDIITGRFQIIHIEKIEAIRLQTFTRLNNIQSYTDGYNPFYTGVRLRQDGKPYKNQTQNGIFEHYVEGKFRGYKTIRIKKI